MQLGNWWSLTAGRLNAREERADWASSQSLTSALQLSPRAELIPARWPLPFNPPIPLMPQVTSVAPYRCHGAATEFSCSPLQPFFIRRLPSLPCMLEKSRCLLLPGGLIMSVWPPLTCQDICTCAVDPTALAPWGKGRRTFQLPVDCNGVRLGAGWQRYFCKGSHDPVNPHPFSCGRRELGKVHSSF